jgi:hypothetical protein
MVQRAILGISLLSLLAACGGATPTPTVDVAPTRTRVAELTQVAAALAPTATIAATRRTTTSATSGGTTIIKDETGLCQAKASANFVPSQKSTGFWTDKTAEMQLSAITTDERSFESYISERGFYWRSVDGSRDRYRSDHTVRNGELLLTYVITLSPPDSRITTNQVICLASISYPAAQDAHYRVLAETMVASVSVTKP